MLAGDLFEADAATCGQVRESGFEFADDIEAFLAEEDLELSIDAVAIVEVANEVENREAVLSRMETQAAAELLEKDREAVGGAQK
jgi:hypothetical protein